MRERVVFMGTPEFSVPILESLIQNQYHLVAVYTRPDKPAGRRQRLTSPPVKRLAMEHKIPVIQPRTLKSAEVVGELASFKPGLIVVAAFGHFLPEEVLSLPEFGCVNVHPSLLPLHRGPSPVADTILCGDLLTGVTIMLMDAGMDSGPILSQREVGVSSEDTTGSLISKLADVGAELLVETLPKWLKGELAPRPQDEGRATYSKLITNRDGQIDWHLPAVELWRRVRAFNPWPGCYTSWQGKRLKIHKAVAVGKRVNGKIGEVIALPQPSPVKAGIATGEGVLGLCRVQLEGKREMSVDDFVRGHRDFIGSILGPG